MKKILVLLAVMGSFACAFLAYNSGSLDVEHISACGKCGKKGH